MGTRRVVRIPGTSMARIAWRVLDADDRRLLLTLVVWAVLFVVACVVLGFGVGLSVRAFYLGMGA